MQQYIGAFYKKMFTLLTKEDECTIGQKLTQLEKISKKRLFDLSDKEIYDALERVIAEDTTDTKLTDEEFNNWVNNH
jgi:hypothetical protein